jgi:hypothetical protein
MASEAFSSKMGSPDSRDRARNDRSFLGVVHELRGREGLSRQGAGIKEETPWKRRGRWEGGEVFKSSTQIVAGP